MTTVLYGSSDTYLYYLASSDGQLGISVETTIEWAAVGTGDPVQVWFEGQASGNDVNVGDSVYIGGKGRAGVTRYLVRRPVGETLKWSNVRSDAFTIQVNGMTNGQPLPVDATVVLTDGSLNVGLGDDSYVELTNGDALPFQVTMTSS